MHGTPRYAFLCAFLCVRSHLSLLHSRLLALFAAQVHGVRGGLGRRGEGEGAARGLLAVVKRMPELLHMMRLQDRERVRQCARVVRPHALRRRRRRSRVLQRVERAAVS